MSMSHSEREIVPEGRTNERKGALSFELITSVLNIYATCECQQRSGECVMGCAVYGGRTDKSSASDNIVTNCSNLAFYFAFFRHPVQIHEKGVEKFALGGLADKTSSTVHHTLIFVHKLLGFFVCLVFLFVCLFCVFVFFFRNTRQHGMTVI